MKFERRCGILLHPTSLPGRFGIGDFGEEALRFIDFLIDSGQTYWQILPLSPPDFANSPYESLSAFAGNPILISPDELIKDGYLKESDLQDIPKFSENKVEFTKVKNYKTNLLSKAYEYFKKNTTSKEKKLFEDFCQTNQYWLNDFSLFFALMLHHNNLPWQNWDSKTKRRDKATLKEWKQKLANMIEKQKFFQWQFYKQWLTIKNYANSKSIKIIGDIPIFVSMNSADVWANTDMFYFDDNLKPIVVSGVPPDYFSETGQLWGHPLYNWKETAKRKYEWWINRFRIAFTLANVVRIDHFRGFYNYWEVQSAEKTALNGRWQNGPGEDFFYSVINKLGDVQIIAENLGDFDIESKIGVENLRKKFSFPGMNILQFAFGSDHTDSFLPHNYKHDCVVYTGTHDNDTTSGWYNNSSTEKERDHARRYMAVSGSDISWDLIRLGWSSIADTAITTVQDILNLGSDSRMNLPSSVGPDNWSWRLLPNELNKEIANRLKELTILFGRNRE